jgi:hypothetical protein
VALYVYCTYLGIIHTGDYCSTYLSPWLIVNGLLGLGSVAMVITVSVPAGVSEDASENRRGFLRGRIAPPRFAHDGAVGGENNRVLVSVMGFFQFLLLVWFCVGTAWVAQTSLEECEASLYRFCMVFIVGLWALVLLAFFISCVAAAVELCRKRRRQAKGESLGQDEDDGEEAERASF